MTAPARKSAAKKAPAKKATAAVRARKEVRAENNTPEPLTITFRGEKFEIPRDRLGSARVLMRLQHLRRYPTLQAEVDVLFELLGQVDSGRFINLCGPGDDIESVYNEFMSAANKAANVPNS